MSNLFDKIGGREAVEMAVDIFYKKVLRDDRINRFFKDIDMSSQRGKQVLFLSYAFGGLESYPGKSMKKAHERFVKDGLNDAHFDAVVENLGETLKELNVSDSLISEVAEIAESTRDDILGR